MTKVYVLSIASPDTIESTVYADKARCRKEFHNLIDQIMAHYDEPSLDMTSEDNEDDGSFYDGYGLTVVWRAEEIVK